MESDLDKYESYTYCTTNVNNPESGDSVDCSNLPLESAFDSVEQSHENYVCEVSVNVNFEEQPSEHLTPHSECEENVEKDISKSKNSADVTIGRDQSDTETDRSLSSEDNKQKTDSLNNDSGNASKCSTKKHSRSSSRKSETQQGGKQITKNYACDYPECNAKFARPWKLAAHHCKHTGERPFMCSRVGCNKSYTNPTHLRRHDLKTHGGQGDLKKEPVKRYKCSHPNCWLVDHPGFCTVPGLKKHEMKHKLVDQNGLVCADCSMTFTRLNDLKTHRFEHDSILPFKCEFCGRAYLHSYEFKKHLRNHKKYKCHAVGCETLEFITFKELQKHRVIHNDIRCEYCQKTFTMQCRLRVHLEEVHFSQEQAQWACTVEGCGRIFTLRRNMVQHVKQKHEGSGHACPVQGCGLKFVWKQSLNKHMQQHLDECAASGDDGREPKKKKKPKKQPRRGPARAKRKDAAIPKASAAEILSDVVVDRATKRQLLNKQQFDTDEEAIDDYLSEKYDDASDSSNSDDNAQPGRFYKGKNTFPSVEQV